MAFALFSQTIYFQCPGRECDETLEKVWKLCFEKKKSFLRSFVEYSLFSRLRFILILQTPIAPLEWKRLLVMRNIMVEAIKSDLQQV